MSICSELAVVLILVVILALILIVVLILVLVLILITVLVLVVHGLFLRNSLFYGDAVMVSYPKSQDLSLALKIKLAIKPEKIAAVIPPAVAFSPPVKIPMKPSLSIASRTPFAILWPKPVKGTVAPA